MDLDDLRISGARPAQVTGVVVRELTEADVALLSLDRGSKPAPLKRIRDNHHALARALATGASATEAGMITGFSESRISILRADPSFQELVEFYRKNQEASVADLHDRMAQLSMDSINELHERLVNDPNSFGNAELRKLVESLADRTGFGPKTTQVNVNLDLADRLNRARARAGLQPGGEQCRTIELRPEPIPLAEAPSPTVLGTDGEAGEPDA